MKVKFCGFKNIEDINFALNLGVDLIGLNNISISKRFLDKEQIINIVSLLDIDSRKKIVVLIDHFDEEFLIKLKKLGLMFLQSYLACDQALSKLGFEIIKVFLLENESDLDLIKKTDLKTYKYILLDKKTIALGGTGEVFDWALFESLKTNLGHDLILAGGLNINNIVDAISQTGAEFIDLASGIEENGQKSTLLMKKFMDKIKKFEV